MEEFTLELTNLSQSMARCKAPGPAQRPPKPTRKGRRQRGHTQPARGGAEDSTGAGGAAPQRADGAVAEGGPVPAQHDTERDWQFQG